MGRRDGCIALEPALSHIAHEIAGGIYTPSEDAGDCYHFCLSLERVMRSGPQPVKFEFDTQVTALTRSGNSSASVETNRHPLEADCYVVTLGAQSVFLLRPIGIDAPIYPLKGYSLTLPIVNTLAAPHVSITDHKRKVVYARLGDELRVAGMADITNYRADPDPARIEVLVRQASHVVRLASRDAEGHAGARAHALYEPAAQHRPRRARLHARVRLRQDHGRPGGGPQTGNLARRLYARVSAVGPRA